MASESELFPLRVAAIDIGSNALRFLAAEFESATEYRVLEQTRSPVRLGHDVFVTGALSPAAVEAAIAALAQYGRTMRALDITHYRAVATSAVRDARDGSELVERALSDAGIAIEVIGGSEEARLVHRAVANHVAMRRGRWLLMDLGGGSVEISLVDAGGIHRSASHDIGSVRLLEELGVIGDDAQAFRLRVEEYVAALRSPLPRRSRASGFIATGGNAEAIARLVGTAPDAAGVSTLKLSDVHALIERLSALTVEQRVQQLELRPDRADVLLPAAIVYERFCTIAGFHEMQVPFVGLKEGVLLDLTDDLAEHGVHSTRRHQQIRHSAQILGRRYRFDQAHAKQVARLALALFDQLLGKLELAESDRPLLLAAALLHDIGIFIGYRRHHKHTYYILSQAELPGMTTRDMQIVAHTARYHRKSLPSPQHVAFMELDDDARSRVTRLAALLRVADALDREHLQNVHEIQAHMAADEIVLRVRGHGTLLLEKWAITKKGDLLEKVLDRDIRVECDAA